mmetsp:Transcript_19589/g.45556  ORF Transcript_19589/g.45556 Transcript_19589/m.45556 type:complete len:469 (+) Transcript_19589:86-1492(+)|eukprot:CAMPEP_0178416206 /NCGR_PEP_ID=MMETSP0689_2-20121128/23945_1 /TAXON_ID=160604 /ORGANISM="Amphidinium massartii, Strain CS-259" /LENGTH=468 /DNA_ID=CAMNT_0020037545 /DNA_START=1 /DNA_END=1407 /DNA_ORIENTATION=+
MAATLALAIPSQSFSSTALVPSGQTAARNKDIAPGCELRIIVEDDKHAKVKLLGDPTQTIPRPGQKPKPPCTAEMFGAELVPGQEYPLLGGTRAALYTWHGCRIQVIGPTLQEYDAPNIVMRDYLACASVLEQRRQRAVELDQPAPRVLVCGSAFSGKSSFCQMLCNYALRRECTPIYVDLDTRYSNMKQLQGLPGCVSAMPVEHSIDEEPFRRMSYFYGHVDWTENQRLYERVAFHLSRVVSAKLSHSTSPEGARVASAGLIANAPSQPTPDLLVKLIEMFDIDVVFVLDNESLHAALQRQFADSQRVGGVPKVEVVPLPKSGGVVQDPPQRIKMLRALRIREYFKGVMRDFQPYPVLVDPADVQLVQIEATQVSASMMPLGQESAAGVDFVVRKFRGTPQELKNVLLAVVRANSLNEVLYAPICGLVLVTKVEENGALQLLCPAPPPLLSPYLLVGDTKSLRFLDI